ncbi:hypothetical protein LR48_Vigan02g079400 [Vigna angularis]|uniref:Uncharacterized protein n=1 Tax=Phaseolus angularis TaxID=3914 RepID=A0A0L9TWT6_PHAAN|nr:hypothetical protein LR48_Vigan02g079400 [Vigna angularis]
MDQASTHSRGDVRPRIRTERPVIRKPDVRQESVPGVQPFKNWTSAQDGTSVQDDERGRPPSSAWSRRASAGAAREGGGRLPGLECEAALGVGGRPPGLEHGATLGVGGRPPGLERGAAPGEGGRPSIFVPSIFVRHPSIDRLPDRLRPSGLYVLTGSSRIQSKHILMLNIVWIS